MQPGTWALLWVSGREMIGGGPEAKRQLVKLKYWALGALLDVDRFKDVNDTLAHTMGDQLLHDVGKRLTTLQREDNDTAGRIGGDVFVVLLPELNRLEDGSEVARRALAAIRQPFVLDGHGLPVTSSLGIAICPDDGEERDTLVGSTDIAMCCAKENGRDNWQQYELPE